MIEIKKIEEIGSLSMDEEWSASSDQLPSKMYLRYVGGWFKMVSDIPHSNSVQSGWAAPVATCVMAELVLPTVLLVLGDACGCSYYRYLPTSLRATASYT